MQEFRWPEATLEGHLVKMEWLLRHSQAESGRMTRLAREERREVSRGSKIYKKA